MAAIMGFVEWLEQQQMSRAELLEQRPLKIDVIDLTLLLKTMGLKLEYLDFAEEKSSTESLTVDIKCNRSGVRATMSYDLHDCSCPEKDEKEASFWEVQATGPQVFSKFKNNTSSNLLPEVSENCSMVSKALLSNLLDYYRSSIKSIERGEETQGSPVKVGTPKISVTSPGMSELRNPCDTPPAEGKYTPRVGFNRSTDSTTKMNPALSPAKIKTEPVDADEKPADDTGSTFSNRSAGVNDVTRELFATGSEEQKSEEAQSIQPTPEKAALPDDASFANSEAMQALITSSPNEKVFDSLLKMEMNNACDANVIHCLEQARQQIDSALLVMRLNKPGHQLPATSVVSTTPQTVVRKSIATPANRRMSMPGLPGRSAEPIKPGSAPGLLKKKVSQLAASSKALISSRGDTPRPTAAQLKVVSTLRKTSSAGSISGGASSSSSTSTATVASTTTTTTTTRVAKPAVLVRKPVTGVRPVPVVARPGAAGKAKSNTSVTAATKK